MTGSPPLTRRLVEQVLAFRLRDLPPAVVADAKLVLLDTLGAAIQASSSAYPTTRILADFVQRCGGRAESSLVGQGRKSSCVNAALFNSALAAYCLTEPLHVGTTLHAPAVMAPTGLAVAERERAAGARFLEAFVLGIEVACRVSAALDAGALYRRAFHPSAVCSTFGAAVAAGHLLRLDAPRLSIALGLALQQASGLLAWIGDPTESARPFNPAMAARNGTTAATLAALGFGGPSAPFEGKHSAFVAFSGAGRPDALLEGWGTRYYVREFTHKVHASCSYTHPALDALLELCRDHGLTPRHVHRITVRFPASALHLVTDRDLRSCYTPYVLAVGLSFGRVTIDDIVEDRTGDPEVARLVAYIEVVGDRELDETYPERCASVVEVRTTDGSILSKRVDHAKGTVENPLTPAEIRAKYRAMAETVTSRADAEAIADLVDRIEDLPHLDQLAAALRNLTRPGPGRARRRTSRRRPGD